MLISVAFVRDTSKTRQVNSARIAQKKKAEFFDKKLSDAYVVRGVVRRGGCESR